MLLSFLLPFSLSAYLHVSKTIEACRVHLFDVVTQYKAIFPDDDSVLVGIRGGSSQQFEGALFCGWLNSKVRNAAFLLKFIPWLKYRSKVLFNHCSQQYKYALLFLLCS